MRELSWQDVVLRPVVTEKTIRQSERKNTYTFEVRDGANKIQIRHAVERIFKVHVTDVRTLRCLGKLKRMGRSVGHTANWKKAVVRVKAGDTIDFY